MKQMKIRIHSPEHSEQVQKVLFELGYEWISGKTFKNFEQPFLFTWLDGDITYSNSESHFENKKYPEYVLQKGTLVLVNQTIMQPMKIDAKGKGVEVLKALYDRGCQYSGYSEYKDVPAYLYESLLFVKNDIITHCNNDTAYFKEQSYPEYEFFNGEFVPIGTKDTRFPFFLTQNQAESIIDIACNSWKETLINKWANDYFIEGTVKVTEHFYKEMCEACTAEQHKLFDEIFGKDEPVRTLQEIVDEFEGRITLSPNRNDKAQVDDKRIIIYTPPANTQWFLEAVKYFQNLLQYLHNQPEIRKCNTFPTIEDNRLTIVVSMEY